MTMQKKLAVQALQWTGDALKVLDQRQLPEKIVYDEYNDAAGVTEAIATMRVRGAPAIGIAAAYGVVLSVQPALFRRSKPVAAKGGGRYRDAGKVQADSGQFVLGIGSDESRTGSSSLIIRWRQFWPVPRKSMPMILPPITKWVSWAPIFWRAPKA